MGAEKYLKWKTKKNKKQTRLNVDTIISWPTSEDNVNGRAVKVEPSQQ